ncbi:MAG: hypothetical protein PHF93_01240, partial [Acidobacteriota bacterium]|nr:hypothetical protein [Acidobacteriota bacterium]MDD8038303.1 hypothetical protein [Acidobacteriota bacterium]MDW3226402.1 hypothetical protein [Acidobacteriota bacterium]
AVWAGADGAFLFLTFSFAPPASPCRLQGGRRAGRLALIITSRIAVVSSESTRISAGFRG